MANSLSNLFTIYFASHAAWCITNERLPARFLVGSIGFLLVGIGSFAFHASLLYEAQLADELPMIYVSSMSLWLLYDYQLGFDLSSAQTKLQVTGLVLFNVLFTWSYFLYRNPVYHQFVFAAIIISCAFRITYLLKWSPVRSRIPDDKKAQVARLFGTGAVTFALGFLIWNLDNVFCDALTKMKPTIGWPAAFLLEGHSWWHFLTGLGTYFMFIGTQCTAVCIKDDHRKFTIQTHQHLPYVKRIDK
ncbi:alkaline phytoceramidase [Dendrothele bispora CBS 962.96]|uniref:Alkaline phytoceramidase n=1 Tax=Dendrothele bispora (strain CBS 962.96) TaxID=1314807 RepID=A0A4S8MWQ8_DENBC|nr:alkaline phytoceramidase [Dendrothele bispora CBS 962.96]